MYILHFACRPFIGTSWQFMFHLSLPPRLPPRRIAKISIMLADARNNINRRRDIIYGILLPGYAVARTCASITEKSISYIIKSARAREAARLISNRISAPFCPNILRFIPAIDLRVHARRLSRPREHSPMAARKDQSAESRLESRYRRISDLQRDAACTHSGLSRALYAVVVFKHAASAAPRLDRRPQTPCGIIARCIPIDRSAFPPLSTFSVSREKGRVREDGRAGNTEEGGEARDFCARAQKQGTTGAARGTGTHYRFAIRAWPRFG